MEKSPAGQDQAEQNGVINTNISPELNKCFALHQCRDACEVTIDLTHADFSINEKGLSAIRDVMKSYKGFGCNRYMPTYLKMHFPSKLKHDLEPVLRAILADSTNRELRQ